jgi:hypothetical protein
MDLMASLRALRRQWILTGFLLVLTFMAAVAVWVKLPGPYSTKSMVALVPSLQASKLNGNNPYMSYGGSENVAGDIILREVLAPATASALAAQGDTGSYSIVDDPTTGGPIVDITVTGSSKAVVESTLRAVTDEFQAKLASLQQSYLPVNRITSTVVSYNPTPTLEISKKARELVLAAGLGLVLTYALPQILDAEVTRRRARRASRYGPPAREDEHEPQPDQQSHRRRYRPAVEDPELVPPGSRSAARPYVDRSRGAERTAPPPVPSDGDVSAGAPEPRPGREAARRREFTY